MSDEPSIKLDQGLLAGIALAGANRGIDKEHFRGDDGILTATEVAALNLENVEMVVLSACETSLGAMTSEGSLQGLQRAFHVAGVKTVVASLWNVDDQYTMRLMELFYRNLFEGRMGKLESLQQAQLSILRDERLRAIHASSGDDTIPPEFEDRVEDIPRGLELTEDASDAASREGTKIFSASPWLWAAWTLSGDPGSIR